MATTEQTYITRSGDLLDAICKAHYGTESPATEAVLEANPGLAEHAAGPLPAGLTITLPAIEPQQDRDIVRLWD